MAKGQRDAEKELLWRSRIEEWKVSPLNVAEFCRSRSINEHTFRSWQKVIAARNAETRQNGERQRPGRRQRGLLRESEKIEFAPVTLVEKHPQAFSPETRFAEQRYGSIEIVTPRGYIVRLPISIDSPTLQMVFTAIERSCYYFGRSKVIVRLKWTQVSRPIS